MLLRWLFGLAAVLGLMQVALLMGDKGGRLFGQAGLGGEQGGEAEGGGSQKLFHAVILSGTSWVRSHPSGARGRETAGYR